MFSTPPYYVKVCFHERFEYFLKADVKCSVLGQIISLYRLRRNMIQLMELMIFAGSFTTRFEECGETLGDSLRPPRVHDACWVRPCCVGHGSSMFVSDRPPPAGQPRIPGGHDLTPSSCLFVLHQFLLSANEAHAVTGQHGVFLVERRHLRPD